jgi:hypothetical protein
MLLLMLSTRPFRLLIAVLITLGLHVCCCEFSVFDTFHGGGSLESAACAGECDGHGDADRGQDSRSLPAEAPHDCCGVHAKPLTIQTPKFELPALSIVTVAPTFIVFLMDEDRGIGHARSATPRATPRPETSLLRCHCALIV